MDIKKIPFAQYADYDHRHRIKTGGRRMLAAAFILALIGTLLMTLK